VTLPVSDRRVPTIGHRGGAGYPYEPVRVPHVRISERGPNMIFFECFYILDVETVEGLRPSFSAHVR